MLVVEVVCGYMCVVVVAVRGGGDHLFLLLERLVHLLRDATEWHLTFLLQNLGQVRHVLRCLVYITGME